MLAAGWPVRLKGKVNGDADVREIHEP